MFGILKDIADITLGVVVKTTVALVADAVTMGGAMNEREEPYTVSAIRGVGESLENLLESDD